MTWQNPIPNRGAPPSGVGSVVSGPQPYLIGGPNQTTSAARILGENPMQLCGVYDTRPWEGKPSELAAGGDFYRQAKLVEGERLVMRLEHVTGAGPFQTTDARALELNSALLSGSLSLLIAAYEAPVGSYVRTPIQPRTPRLPDANPWPVADLAQMGPNVLPELLTAGVAEVDLSSWSRRSRFVAVWLWGFWAGIGNGGAIDQGLAIQYSVSARPHFEPWTYPTISWPVLALPDGPFTGPTDATALWRFGSFPSVGGTNVRRVSVVNGGANAATVQFRHYVGPAADHATYTGADDVIAVPAGGTVVRTLVDRTGYSHTGVWGAQTAPSGLTDGPLILSVTGGG